MEGERQSFDCGLASLQPHLITIEKKKWIEASCWHQSHWLRPSSEARCSVKLNYERHTASYKLFQIEPELTQQNRGTASNKLTSCRQERAQGTRSSNAHTWLACPIHCFKCVPKLIKRVNMKRYLCLCIKIQNVNLFIIFVIIIVARYIKRWLCPAVRLFALNWQKWCARQESLSSVTNYCGDHDDIVNMDLQI